MAGLFSFFKKKHDKTAPSDDTDARSGAKEKPEQPAQDDSTTAPAAGTASAAAASETVPLRLHAGEEERQQSDLAEVSADAAAGTEGLKPDNENPAAPPASEHGEASEAATPESVMPAPHVQGAKDHPEDAVPRAPVQDTRAPEPGSDIAAEHELPATGRSGRLLTQGGTTGKHAGAAYQSPQTDTEHRADVSVTTQTAEAQLPGKAVPVPETAAGTVTREASEPAAVASESLAMTEELAGEAVPPHVESVPADAAALKAPAADADATPSRATFFDRLRRTRENLASGFSSFMKGRNIDADLYDELETSLLTSDLGVDTTMHVIDRLRNEARLRELHDAVLLKNKLHDILCDILRPCEVPLSLDLSKKPYVILMVGVNGSGKTTTIGKLAQRYSAQGLKIMLAAGDTFRAAAIEQLKVWGQRTGIPVISQTPGSDSASVLFDALTAAKSRDIDLLICDTAGRLQNKSHLMDELAKIVRVMKKNDEEAPHEVMLVLDGTTGQNAISQARTFSSVVNVTGVCLTKLDGTAKGGVIFALADKFRIPIRFVGIGEHADDLREFTTKEYVDAVLGVS